MVSYTGFTFKFETDTPIKERNFYYQSYEHNINSKLSELKHCTSCNSYISINRIEMHPLLHITLCANCHRLYKSVDFNTPGNRFCLWCGKGTGFLKNTNPEKKAIPIGNSVSGGIPHTRRSCSKCKKVFCHKCILMVVSAGEEVGDDWKCFCCAPEALYELKAQHFALVNYAAKQKMLNEK